ncbi:MAG TPA: IclR family transcriptional regulator [Terriglobia bacterium]|nr:IclR family transcriptional regulator [Terriglobia bacterium]
MRTETIDTTVPRKGPVTASVSSVDRALTFLETLAKSNRGMTLADIARKLRLPKSSAHCILLTLERRGYIYRVPSTHRYLFGMRLLNLAQEALGRLELRARASGPLRRLLEQTQMTVHMAIYEDGEAVLVEKLEPLTAVKMASHIGRRLDLHCTGVGKALLAYLPDDEINRLRVSRIWARHNENTIVFNNKLQAELEHIRKVGYSFDNEEDEIGFRCVGAPIFENDRTVIAAISVAGTTAQITGATLDSLARIVKDAADEISQRFSIPVNRALEEEFENSRRVVNF